ncbi:hypothetical protein CBS101457_003846 [Exobasidium rhododendri]|nr:hypothetical protein CBS101457_003846 [Exobasidium rhododendri]
MQAALIALPVNVDPTGAKILDGDGASGSDQKDSRDIWLPNWVETVSHIAVDIGGSLAKVVYFTRAAKPSQPKASSASSHPSTSSDSEHISVQNAGSSAAVPSSPRLSSHSSSPSGSRLHSQDSSVNAGARPSRSRSPLYSHPQTADGSFALPGGALTPTSLFHSQPPFDSKSIRSQLLAQRALPSSLPGGRLNFIRFETEHISDCVDFLKELISSSAKANNVSLEQMRKGVKLMATGGGAHMFADLFERELGVEVRREDEMSCLITGLNFITLIPDESYYYSDELVASLHSSLPQARSPITAERPPIQDQLPRPSPDPPLYAPCFDSDPLPKLPCLLVNIGSGVSIIKVDDHGKFERVSGTSLGGGTLWGLLSLLTDAESFDEMLELASEGDNGSVDMLVSDIYGSSDSLNSLGLKSNTIASSFGKVFRKEDRRGDEGTGRARERRKKKFRQEDICKSLLYAVSNNIGQIAYMNAEKFGLDRIYFGGCFIRGHQATIATLSYAIRFWSKGTKRAFFLRHEGYLGAIGCWIKQLSDPDPSSTHPKTKEDQSTAEKHDTVGKSNIPESNVSTPKADREPAINGYASHKINPMLAEALGSLAMSDDSPTLPGRSSKSTPLQRNGSDSFAEVVVDSKDVQALSGESEELQNLSSLFASLSEGDKGLTESLLANNGKLDEKSTIADLLQQLENASGAADGLESKLDSLLGRLDSLLEEEDR